MGRVSFEGMGDALGEIGIFARASSLDEIEQRLREQIALEVAAISSLIAECDGFDVIELMRQREVLRVTAAR
jgi:hypothetical protein